MKRLSTRNAWLMDFLTFYLSVPAAGQDLDGLAPLHLDSGAPYRESNMGWRNANTYHNGETLGLFGGPHS